MLLLPFSQLHPSQLIRTASWLGCGLMIAWLLGTAPAGALPPPDDPPEEVLRTEIIIEARSPVDGQPVSPAEYARLQEELSDRGTPVLSRRVSNTIRLLRIRQAIRAIFPFLLR